MTKAEIKGLAFRLLMLVALVGVVFAVPAFAQQPICRAQCIEVTLANMQYCLLTNPGGIGSIVCGAGVAALEILCGVLCIITG
ncbi:MAG: hypothetical protein GEU99_03020 [Luteitalea sp.]|nr:hypothetical protein [Luteitalea sp.]